jgi:SAM-dependent methyltransferase
MLTRAQLFDARVSRYRDDIDSIRKLTAGTCSLLEIGCGTGRIISQLTHIPQRYGLDIDPDYLQLASQKDTASQCKFVAVDFLEYKSPQPVDCILFAFNVIAEFLTPARRILALQHACNWLTEDGYVLLFLYTHNFAQWGLKEKSYEFEFDDTIYATGKWRCQIHCLRNHLSQYADCTATYTSLQTGEMVVDHYRNALITRNEMLLTYRLSGLTVVTEYGDYDLNPADESSDNLIHILKAS